MASIFIIDDKPYMSQLLSKDLSREGYFITYSENVVYAIDRIRTIRPDIILLDIYFKQFPGWGILHLLKVKYPDIPVVIVTSSDGCAGDPQLEEADGYVIKEIYTDKLKKMILEILQKKGTHQNELPQRRAA